VERTATRVAVSALIVILALVLTFAWRHFETRRSFQAGGIYSVADEKGFRVAKILVIDADAIHVRVYKNLFTTRPSEVDEADLTLGTIYDKDGFGIGHLPLSKEQFSAWGPVFIKRSSVSKDELDGYEEWKESHGGVWDKPK
jgi:hypothetical protein